LVGFDVLQQQINPIRRFNSNAQTPDSGITHYRQLKVRWLDNCQKDGGAKNAARRGPLPGLKTRRANYPVSTGERHCDNDV
jgi:hypothetical protein